jgi:hypothetical protein
VLVGDWLAGQAVLSSITSLLFSIMASSVYAAERIKAIDSAER